MSTSVYTTGCSPSKVEFLSVAMQLTLFTHLILPYFISDFTIEYEVSCEFVMKVKVLVTQSCLTLCDAM